MSRQGVTIRAASRNRSRQWGEIGETLQVHRPGIRRDDHRPNPENHADRLLDRVFTHLRAHVAELRRLEGAGAKQEELEECRALIEALQGHLADLVRTTLTSPP
jgi:hypothetical protein